MPWRHNFEEQLLVWFFVISRWGCVIEVFLARIHLIFSLIHPPFLSKKLRFIWGDGFFFWGGCLSLLIRLHFQLVYYFIVAFFFLLFFNWFEKFQCVMMVSNVMKLDVYQLTGNAMAILTARMKQMSQTAPSVQVIKFIASFMKINYFSSYLQP